MKNVIMNFKEVIPKPVRNLAIKVKKIFKDVQENIYNYTLYSNETNYTIIYHISQDDKYNKIDKNCAAINIINAIVNDYLRGEHLGIISYEQPPIGILIEVLEPMIHSLSNREYNHWKNFLELQDIEQICSMTICELYKKGYYIHKSLVSKALANNIYRFLRIDDHRGYSVVSIYKPTKYNDEKMTVGETIFDTAEANEAYDRDVKAALEEIHKEQRDIVIEMIGKRQYDQLLREWQTATTTGVTQKRVFALKNKMIQLGLTGDVWNKYFE